jgi:predicted methyltransferase
VSKESAADIVRALVKLELVVIEKGRPKLNRKGRELVELKILQ